MHSKILSSEDSKIQEWFLFKCFKMICGALLLYLYIQNINESFYMFCINVSDPLHDSLLTYWSNKMYALYQYPKCGRLHVIVFQRILEICFGPFSRIDYVRSVNINKLGQLILLISNSPVPSLNLLINLEKSVRCSGWLIHTKSN